MRGGARGAGHPLDRQLEALGRGGAHRRDLDRERRGVHDAVDLELEEEAVAARGREARCGRRSRRRFASGSGCTCEYERSPSRSATRCPRWPTYAVERRHRPAVAADREVELRRLARVQRVVRQRDVEAVGAPCARAAGSGAGANAPGDEEVVAEHGLRAVDLEVGEGAIGAGSGERQRHRPAAVGVRASGARAGSRRSRGGRRSDAARTPPSTSNVVRPRGRSRSRMRKRNVVCFRQRRASSAPARSV